MTMEKRDFLKAIALGSATLFLDGCSNPLVQQIFLSDPLHGDGPLPMTPEDIAASRDARRIFDSYRQTGKLPSSLLWRPNEEDKAAIAAWMNAIEPYRSLKVIPFSAVVSLATAIAPVLRIANDMANGIPEIPAKKLKPSMVSRKLASLSGTTITVPARSLVQFTQRGHCMDSTLPAPGEGEKLRLLLMSRLIPRKLLPIYYGLVKMASVDQKVQMNMQLLVWALREAGTIGPHANAIGPAQLALMALAYPHGDQIFLHYHKTALAQKKLNDLVQSFLKIRISGREYNLADFSNPERAQAIVSQTLADLTRMPIAGNIPNDDSDYSMLAPGVAVYAVGAGTLIPKITVANTTETPYELDISHYFAESRRRAQRIALTPPEKLLTQYGERPDEQASANERQKMFEKFWADTFAFLRDKTIEYFPEYSRLPWVKKTIEKVLNPRLVKLIELVPVVGNLMEFHKAYFGTSVFSNNKPIGCAERVLAALGSVPGAKIFTKVAGSGLPKAIKLLAQSAVAEKIVKSLEKISLERDIATWLTSETAEMFYTPLEATGDVSQRFTEIMTGGCGKTKAPENGNTLD